jgi:hypothetical protein
VIDGARDAGLAGAVGTAIIVLFGFLNAVPYDLAAAVCANRGQLVDRTLKAIENMPVAGCHDLE